MRHYVAVEREDGRWFYANEGTHRVTGLPGWSPAAACRECEGHATAEEAYEHERQRQLDERLQFYPDREDANTLERCRADGCDQFTSGFAYVGAYRHWQLCSAHRNRETVETLFVLGESWES